MAMEKQRRLVALLLEKTRRDELEWSESMQKDTYQVSLSTNTVRIHASPNEFDVEELNVAISLINGDGKVVDRFSDFEAGEGLDSVEDKAQFYKEMSELYELARRTALGSEKVLNQILRDLDDEIPF